ncbi:DNA adenine methylase [Bacillus sp. JCM 19046]|nr:DNA adenine methylase [Bacillus sp. JCM 19045]GAF16888.1 DNA adenine methylase [Bacillus sp. JCM 19046]
MAGGKRQLLPLLHQYVPLHYERYIEPFAGGAALCFSLAPPKALIGDVNQPLINTYKVIRDKCEQLLEDLQLHQNQEAYYYAMRDLDRQANYQALSAVEQASRFLFLNRTSYGGLYRVNKKGQANMPFGHYKKPNIMNEKVIRQASSYLQQEHIHIEKADFVETVLQAEENDFVYFDPPYYSESKRSFGAYTKPFTLYDHIRLKRMFKQLDERGCYLLLSHSDHAMARELYGEYPLFATNATRLVNANVHERMGGKEVLFMNKRLWDEKAVLA